MPAVAVLDDDPHWAEFLTRQLRQTGWSTVSYVSAVEALAESRWEVDVVIADQVMPVMTGLELMTELRSRGYEGTLILLSAYLEPEMTAQAQQLGAFPISKVDQAALFRTMSVLTGVAEEPTQAHTGGSTGS